MAEPTGLLDQYGRPINKGALQVQIAGATLMGVRQAMRPNISDGLTPERLAGLLRRANENDPEAFLSLAEEMEEKDLHYVSVLGTRKRQVAQLPMTMQAASKSALDKVIADACQQDLIDPGAIDEYRFDMLDAIGKGFSLGELMWDFSGPRWKPKCIDLVDPRFVRFDRETMQHPMLIGNDGMDMPLEPYKFIFLKLGSKSGIPIRGGLARPAAWHWLFKNYAIKDWIEFLELYGKPLRVGKFAPGATDDDKNALLRAVAGLGVDAAGIIPNTMVIDFVEAQNKGAAAEIWKALCTYVDEQMSKAVLGQTGTTDATPGKLGGSDDHTQVREDIERADAMAMSAALSRQLVRAYVDLNFGPQPRYPWLKIGREDQADAELMITAAKELVPLGFKVKQSDLRDAVGFTEPTDSDDLLAPAAIMPPIGATPALPMPANDQRAAPMRALAAAIVSRSAEQAKDAIDVATAEQLAGWKQVLDPVGQQILALAAQATGATDIERARDFRARVIHLYPDVATDPLGDQLTMLAFQSFGAGATGDNLS